MDNMSQFKCPNCTAPLRYDAGEQKLVCDNCGSSFPADGTLPGSRPVDEVEQFDWGSYKEELSNEILENVAVGKVYLPDYEGESRKYDKLVKSLTEQHIDTERLREDITYTADGVTYQLYVSGVAYDPEKENDNDMSLAISVTYGGDSWFFAGDLEKKGIKEFLERHGEIRSDILKMPHHGQYVSNTDELLEQVRPKIAVITDGAEKPAEEKLIELLEETQVEYYRSMMNGTIVIKGNGEGEYKTVTDK